MNSKSFFNYQEIINALPGSIERLILSIYPGARKSAGHYRIGSISGEPGRSLSISCRHNDPGVWKDHADESQRGNFISLVAANRGWSYPEAAEWLAKELGVQPESRFEPKPRPKPVINREDMRALSAKALAFAASRKITQETLKAFKVACNDTHLALPHFNDEGEVVMVKYWSMDGQKNVFTNMDPIHTLFGKNTIDPVKSGGTLIITEGQWDAMTWHQLGFPAVSIPSGVSNDQWISEDYVFLNQFTEIFLDFDSDDAGQQAEEKTRARLGYERCKKIAYRFKDANDALKAGEGDLLKQAFKDAVEAPIESIVRPESMRENVRKRLNGSNTIKGKRFFLSSLRMEFRPYELTLWFGKTSHGKSSLLQQQIAYEASQGEISFIGSFEQNTSQTMAAMILQYTADQDIGSKSEFDAAYEELSSRVLFYDSVDRVNPDKLIATMTQAHKQLGVTTFVVDNVMTLEVDRQDNTNQAETADKFRVFASRYPVHVHLVAHPRKEKEGANGVPAIADIRGASEWGDMAHNVIVVWRDVEKSEAIATMVDEGMDQVHIEEFRRSKPDGKVLLRKQRMTGDLPVASYFYDQGTKRAWKHPEDWSPYWGGIHDLIPEEDALQESPQ